MANREFHIIYRKFSHGKHEYWAEGRENTEADWVFLGKFIKKEMAIETCEKFINEEIISEEEKAKAYQILYIDSYDRWQVTCYNRNKGINEALGFFETKEIAEIAGKVANYIFNNARHDIHDCSIKEKSVVSEAPEYDSHKFIDLD